MLRRPAHRRSQAQLDAEDRVVLVSDGLLLDTMRLADASELNAHIELDELPLSSAFVAEHSAWKL